MALYSIESEIKNVTSQERGIHNISLDELPYEVWMKHILKAYRKDKERLEQLQRYAGGDDQESDQRHQPLPHYTLNIPSNHRGFEGG